MLTKEKILEAVKNGRESKAFIDQRDYARLATFFDATDLPAFGFKLKEGDTEYKPKEFTQENVIKQLRKDVAFGFEKALNRRGISSFLMAEVVAMWMWVLEDPLEKQAEDLYPMYGLPFFKAVALKYGFDNPIGDDTGNEPKYEEDDD